MGHGIAQQVAATAAGAAAAASRNGNGSATTNVMVIGYEPKQPSLDKGRARVEGSLARLVVQGKLSQDDAYATLQRMTYTTDLQQLAQADIIVESIPEQMDTKKKLFAQLNTICKPETIFASNTTSLSITELALASGRPDRLVGLHFFNPVQLIKLVEVVRTEHADPAVCEKVYHWVQSVGKRAVSCGDTPGKQQHVIQFSVS